MFIRVLRAHGFGGLCGLQITRLDVEPDVRVQNFLSVVPSSWPKTALEIFLICGRLGLSGGRRGCALS